MRKHYDYRFDFERIGVKVRNSYNDNFKKEKKKNFAVVLTACFICLSALVLGTTAIKHDSKKQPKVTNHIDLNAETEVYTTSSSDVAVDGSVSKAQKHQIEETTDSAEWETYESTTNYISTLPDETQPENSAQIETPDHVITNGNTTSLSFNESSKLSWPVNGNVILDYSMDSTIYFPTLDSYKCNPAMVIQSDTGNEVKSGATGVVNEISSNDELGNYIVLDLGNEYSLTFGQLDEVNVTMGEMVTPDTIIGTIATPTRYYANEGPNLYYMLTKDGNPCDPTDYLS